MADPIVLVAGAWHGGWAWRPVAEHLRAAGHTVYAPTLPGLADGDDPTQYSLADMVQARDGHPRGSSPPSPCQAVRAATGGQARPCVPATAPCPASSHAGRTGLPERQLPITRLEAERAPNGGSAP